MSTITLLYMKSLSIIVLLFMSAHSFSQPFTSQQVTEDLAYLIESIKTYNPGLNRYNPDFDVEAKQILNTVDGECDVFTYFQLVSAIVTASNEGHYHVGSWDDVVLKGFLDNVYTYLPLSIKILDGNLYVWYDLSEENALSRGDEIVSINGKSAEEILNLLKRYVHADGSINTYFEKQAESGFAWMYYMYIEQSESFTIRIRRYSDGSESEVKLAPLTVKKRNENLVTRYPEKANTSNQTSLDDLYTFTQEDDYALLTLKSFDYRLVDEFKVEADKLYEDIFTELKKRQTQNLIVDLRGNTGGRNELADEMIPFILKSRTDAFMKKSVSWHGREKTYGFPRKSDLAFEGRIYCLVDGKTYSAGATLARYLKEYGEAIFIGEETGSRYEGYVAGSAEAVNLPNSNIRISIPRYLTYYPTSSIQTTSNRGLMPDYTVKPTLHDVIEEKDVVMQKALVLIKG